MNRWHGLPKERKGREGRRDKKGRVSLKVRVWEGGSEQFYYGGGSSASRQKKCRGKERDARSTTRVRSAAQQCRAVEFVWGLREMRTRGSEPKVPGRRVPHSLATWSGWGGGLHVLELPRTNLQGCWELLGCWPAVSCACGVPRWVIWVGSW